MLKVAAEGDVYKVKTNQNEPHYYIVTQDPDMDGTFLVASLTDAQNKTPSTDVWESGYILSPSFTLIKDSVIHLRYVEIVNQAWLVNYGAVYIGVATPAALKRVRCNLHWYLWALTKNAQKRVVWFGTTWSSPCGRCPQNAPKSKP